MTSTGRRAVRCVLLRLIPLPGGGFGSAPYPRLVTFVRSMMILGSAQRSFRTTGARVAGAVAVANRTTEMTVALPCPDNPYTTWRSPHPPPPTLTLHLASLHTPISHRRGGRQHHHRPVGACGADCTDQRVWADAAAAVPLAAPATSAGGPATGSGGTTAGLCTPPDGQHC